jgi:hypothetical protein
MKDNIRTNWEKMDVSQAKMEVRINANNEYFEVLLSGTLVYRVGVHEARTVSIQVDVIAKMDAHQERMGASMNARRNDMTACLEATEACLKKADAERAADRKEINSCLEEAVPCPKKESNPKNIESVAEQQWQLSKH